MSWFFLHIYKSTTDIAHLFSISKKKFALNLIVPIVRQSGQLMDKYDYRVSSLISCIFIILLMISGLVIFMEEDHYVTVDFLHVLNLMQKQNNKQTSKVMVALPTLHKLSAIFNFYTNSLKKDYHSFTFPPIYLYASKDLQNVSLLKVCL